MVSRVLVSGLFGGLISRAALSLEVLAQNLRRLPSGLIFGHLVLRLNCTRCVDSRKRTYTESFPATSSVYTRQRNHSVRSAQTLISGLPWKEARTCLLIVPGDERPADVVNWDHMSRGVTPTPRLLRISPTHTPALYSPRFRDTCKKSISP